MLTPTTTITFTPDQLACLRAVWAYFVEVADCEELIQEALEIPSKDRGLNEDGSVPDDYNADTDAVVTLMDQTETLLMVDGIDLIVQDETKNIE